MTALRLFPSIVIFAAAFHLVGLLAALALSLMTVPTVSALLGAGAASALVLICSLVLHACIDGAFTVAIRRLSASRLTCAVNLLAAHVVIVLIGTGLAYAASSRWAVEAEHSIYVQAAFMFGWSVLSVLCGMALAAVWPRVEYRLDRRAAGFHQRRRTRR
ncbi:hypothetical protein HMPREF2757_07775 [Brevibacterium sp. HMSC063G07]|nr:hypothetical protein HMPREF2757_07775 [Brevibacterium sp. HMSC063G07]OFS25559.1 hypothetical protein HMPREF3162_08255 [Brevibacterium sp. HMSC07C04]